MLLVEKSDGIAVVTLNRPEAMNALSKALRSALYKAMVALDADPEVSVVILTGAGERAFTAGLDLKELGSDPRAMGAANAEGADENPVKAIELCSKPVIGAINGAAVGIGVTMQLPMDIRMASTSARFGFVFARRGITPEAASSWFLPRLVGMQQALEWCFTGRVFGAQEALDGGLVRSIHAPEDLLPAARALAREIVDNTAPVSIALTRQLLWRMAGADHPMEAHRADSRAIMARGAQGDAREGVSSFLEKRAPAYPDKVSSDLPDIWPYWDDRQFK